MLLFAQAFVTILKLPCVCHRRICSGTFYKVHNWLLYGMNSSFQVIKEGRLGAEQLLLPCLKERYPVKIHHHHEKAHVW